MGSDFGTPSQRTVDCRFQSTLPGWGATAGIAGMHAPRRDFNPRSPDGERPAKPRAISHNRHISIHAPRMGSDRSANRPRCGRPISIHAPRMGSDPRARRTARFSTGFQSTLPGWGATRQGPETGRCRPISIHAPRMGSDRENGHLRPRYGQNHPFSTLIVSQIVVDVLGTVRKSQKTPAH